MHPTFTLKIRVGLTEGETKAAWLKGDRVEATVQLGARKKASVSLLDTEQAVQLACLGVMVVYYGFLLSCDPYKPGQLNLTFNSMMGHMLHGQFSVDAGIVGDEGFLSGGKVYAYWGIFCALLRLPLFLFGRTHWDITVWSCLAGACVGGLAKVKALLLIRREVAASREAAWLINLGLLYVLFGGDEAAFLRASIYQEVTFWSSAFAAIFVYFAVKGIIFGSFSRKTLCAMAAMTGLAVITRIPTGVGLCTALTLLLAYLIVQKALLFGWRYGLLVRYAAPVLILAGFLAVAGFVNYARWGNPLVFADFKTYLMNTHYPQWTPRMDAEGYFNLRRLPIGLLYYFVPVWVVQGGPTALPLNQLMDRWMNVVELPPSSLLLTNLFPLIFAVLLFVAFKMRSRVISIFHVGLVATGLAVSCLLMLTAISMSFRYRMEFTPEIDLLGFLGLYVVLSDDRMSAWLSRWRKWLNAAVAVSIVSSLFAMILYKLSYWGPAEAWLGHGIVAFYIKSALP